MTPPEFLWIKLYRPLPLHRTIQEDWRNWWRWELHNPAGCLRGGNCATVVEAEDAARAAWLEYQSGAGGYDPVPMRCAHAPALELYASTVQPGSGFAWCITNRGGREVASSGPDPYALWSATEAVRHATPSLKKNYHL